MKNVIVTGASGFIGQALVKQLTLAGYYVYAVIRNSEKSVLFDKLKNVQAVLCDLSVINRLEELINSTDIEVFFHLAWNGTSGKSREDYDIQLKNVNYTCEAVKTAKKLGCKKFIYAGSLMEYESIKYSFTAGSKPVLNYIYRTAKLTAHYMAKAVAVEQNIDFITGIISNAYGEGEISPRLINSTLRKLLNHEKTSFTTGEQLYDFIYITDVARAFIAIAIEGKPYKDYYIGNKAPRKLKEFLIDLKDCVDENIKLGFGEISFDGVSLNYDEFDTNSLYEDTSFICNIGFKEGIKKTIDWIRNNNDKF